MTARLRGGDGNERSVLIVEDDPSIAKLLGTYLARADFEPVVTATGEQALATFPERTWSAVILDLNLPGLVDGMDVCRSLRSRSDVPIIMLSARDQELDRVLGLEIGADDYVTKPFSPRELVARLKAILRRAHAQAGGDVLTHGQITWDQTKHLALLAGEPVLLTNREFDLLGFLIANRGLALSRRQLLDGVWGPEWYGDDRTVDVHIRQLRRKFGDALQVTTLWGVGYRLD